jgi:hypothetical protein
MVVHELCGSRGHALRVRAGDWPALLVVEFFHFCAAGSGRMLHASTNESPTERQNRRKKTNFCRIWDRYNKPVVSLALLVDGDPKFRPGRFLREKAGCRLEFRFPIVKLLDFKSEEELAKDPSPFAIAALVQLRKLQAGGDIERRYAFKVSLAQELYRRSYQREDILKLLRFMDFLLRLPEIPSARFRNELRVIEEEPNMPYVTSWERLARQEGREEGREEGRQAGILQGAVDLLRQTLEVRFGEVPASLLERLLQCQDVNVLQAFHKQVLTARSLDELRF